MVNDKFKSVVFLKWKNVLKVGSKFECLTFKFLKARPVSRNILFGLKCVGYV